jgi:hypothetical protein
MGVGCQLNEKIMIWGVGFQTRRVIFSDAVQSSEIMHSKALIGQADRQSISERRHHITFA